MHSSLMQGSVQGSVAKMGMGRSHSMKLNTINFTRTGMSRVIRRCKLASHACVSTCAH